MMSFKYYFSGRMPSFSELFVEPQVLFTLVFIMSAVSVFAGGGSYGDGLVFGGLGLLKTVPLALLGQVGSAFPLLAPFAALAFLWYLGSLRVVLGTPIFALIVGSSVILALGA